MTKKKVLRITGIVFSLLIVASVFLPYNSVNNQPLFSLTNTKELLLPIVIMVFGLISVVLYLTNYYCEFPLSTSGAVLFFVIIEAVYAIGNKTVSEFGIGYYLLVAGSVLLFINTIILLISSIKKKSSQSIEKVNNNETVSADLDRLYSPQYNDTLNSAAVYEQPIVQPIVEPVQPVVEPVQSVVEPVQPIVEPVQPVVEPVQPVVEPVQPVVEPVQPVVEPIQPIVEPIQSIVEPVQPIVEPIQSIVEPVQPIVEPLPEIQFEQMPEYKQPITPLYEEPKEVRPEDNIALRSLLEPNNSVGSVEPVNPVLNGFKQPEPVNPVLNDFNQQGQVNPVLQQFDQPMSFIGQPVPQQPGIQVQPQQTTEEVGMSIFNNH